MCAASCSAVVSALLVSLFSSFLFLVWFLRPLYVRTCFDRVLLIVIALVIVPVVIFLPVVLVVILVLVILRVVAQALVLVVRKAQTNYTEQAHKHNINITNTHT